MPAPPQISLTAAEDRTLKELSSADGVPRCTKTRATAVMTQATVLIQSAGPFARISREVIADIHRRSRRSLDLYQAIAQVQY